MTLSMEPESQMTTAQVPGFSCSIAVVLSLTSLMAGRCSRTCFFFSFVCLQVLHHQPHSWCYYQCQALICDFAPNCRLDDAIEVSRQLTLRYPKMEDGWVLVIELEVIRWKQATMSWESVCQVHIRCLLQFVSEVFTVYGWQHFITM